MRSPFFILSLVALSLVTASAAPIGSASCDDDGTSIHARQFDFSFSSAISWFCGFSITESLCHTVGTALGQTQSNPGFVVTLSNGPMTGATSSKGTRFSVPFAQPPIGNLRFKDPQPVRGWSGMYAMLLRRLGLRAFAHRYLRRLRYNASGTPSPCPQNMGSKLASTNEDCLYMQVYVPPNANLNSKLPVFVW